MPQVFVAKSEKVRAMSRIVDRPVISSTQTDRPGIAQEEAMNTRNDARRSTTSDNSKDKGYESRKQEHEHIIQDENHCCLCGSKLKFDHKIDYLTLQIREKAHCPSCRIQMKSREHVLQ
jgi:5-methylcytosine-specific restriction endonuclease McrA